MRKDSLRRDEVFIAKRLVRARAFYASMSDIWLAEPKGHEMQSFPCDSIRRDDREYLEETETPILQDQDLLLGRRRLASRLVGSAAGGLRELEEIWGDTTRDGRHPTAVDRTNGKSSSMASARVRGWR